MSDCEYVKENYGVPACVGRVVIVDGKPGIIADDRGHYIGVNFDKDKPGVILNAHPTWKVKYCGMGAIRKPTRNQARYQRYITFGDCFDSFIDFCRWDAESRRKNKR